MKTGKTKEPFIHLTKRMSISFGRAMLIRACAAVLGLIVCGLLAFLLVDKLREDPKRIAEFYDSFIKGNFATARRRWKFFKNIAVLLCIALAITPAFRMRFWNIGAEGQTLMGILSAIAVNFYLGGKYSAELALPNGVLLLLMFFASLIAGAIWAVIPALCTARWRTNETLFTLMMNYIATYLVSFFLVLWVPSGSSSLGKLDTGKLPAIGHDYLLIILVALALSAALYIYLNFSKHGYEISVVGESEKTARYIGIHVDRVIVRTMLLSGLLCGLAGYLIAAGLDQTVTTESVGGDGFTAIMVSWLAHFNPLLMIVTSGIVVFLNQGADQVSTAFDVSGAFPDVTVGVVLFFIIGSEFFINYKVHFRKRQPKSVERGAIK
ncbi:MAG: ABC transporter permease [Christensenellales bacterium]|jgi:ABC-type uncharacterized transport system permease subunit